MCGGGGSPSGPTTQNVNQSSIPDWAKPYATQMLDNAQHLTSLTDNPYAQYNGTKVAGFNPTQTQAFQNLNNMQLPGQTAQATGAAGMATANALSPQNYASQVNQYMSPYTQTLQNQAIGNYANSLPQLGSAATKVGGLGGSREALMQSQAQQGLQNQLAGIQANAYGNAQNEYNVQNQTALQGANTLGQLGAQTYGQQMGLNAAQLAAGNQQQDLSQKVDSSNYQDFVNAQNYPYKQMGFMSDILHGVPSNASASSFYQPQPNQATGLMSLLGQSATSAGG